MTRRRCAKSSLRTTTPWLAALLSTCILSAISTANETVPEPPDLSQRHYARGKRFLEEGRYEEAAAAFAAASAGPSASVQIAAASRDIPLPSGARRPQSAPDDAQQVLRTRLGQWHLQQARNALAQRMYLAALTHAQRALALNPKDRPAQALAAEAREGHERLKRSGQQEAKLREQAKAAESRGDDRRALKLWKQLAKRRPDDAEAAAGVRRAQAGWDRAHPPVKRASELTAAAAAAPAMQQEYRVSIGDVLEVFVWQQSDLSRDVIVRPDGRISFPLAGDLDAVGRTLEELDQALTGRLTTYIRSPDVSLAIKRFGGTKAIVMGEVARPGVYVPAGQGRVMDIIALAGGFKRNAVRRDVILIRGGVSAPQLAKLNLQAMLEEGNMVENVVLEPNDILYVPEKPVNSLLAFMEQFYPSISETLIGQNIATNFGVRETSGGITR